MKTVTDLQKEVGKTTKTLGYSDNPDVNLLFLLEELGEVARAYLKERGHKNNNNRVREPFRDEMGDVFFMLLRLAHVTGVDLEAAVGHTIKKLHTGQK